MKLRKKNCIHLPAPGSHCLPSDNFACLLVRMCRIFWPTFPTSLYTFTVDLIINSLLASVAPRTMHLNRQWRTTQGGSKSSRICLAIPCLRHRGIARGHLRVEDMENSTTFDADCGAIWGSHKYNLCANMLTDTSCRHIWGQNIIERPYFGSVRHLVRHYHQSLRVGYYGSGME